MTIIKPDDKSQSNWKTQVYVMGAALGTLFGLVSAYLYARAADEDATRRGGKPERIPTGQLIGLVLTALGIIRQISELGKPNKKR